MEWLCPQCGRRYARAIENCPHDEARLVVDLTGRRIGGCLLDALIGVGGDGSTVWEATRPGEERRVAVEVLPVSDDVARDALESRIRAAAGLEHPNLARIESHGQTREGHLYLVMPLLEGVGLDVLLDRHDRIEPRRALRIVGAVLDGMRHAHAHGVVHGALHPANVFIGAGPLDGSLHDQVTVLDVGLGRIPPPELPTALGIDGTVPLGEAPAALASTAPERLVLGEVGPEADQYAIGVLLYRLLAGRAPFEGGRAEVKRGHLSRTPPRLARIAPALADELDVEQLQRIADRLLAKQPPDRFASVGEAGLAVEALIDAPRGLADDDGFLDEMEDSFQNLPQMDLEQPQERLPPPPLDTAERPTVPNPPVPPPVVESVPVSEPTFGMRGFLVALALLGVLIVVWFATRS